MDEEQITINSILECLDFGLRIDEKDIQDLLDIIKKKNEIIKKQSYTNKKLRKTLKTVRKERNKQNKIIYKMAEQLTTPVHSKKWVIDYFTNKVEESD